MDQSTTRAFIGLVYINIMAAGMHKLPEIQIWYGGVELFVQPKLVLLDNFREKILLHFQDQMTQIATENEEEFFSTSKLEI